MKSASSSKSVTHNFRRGERILKSYYDTLKRGERDQIL